MIEKVIAFLDNLDSTELDRLPPAHLRRFEALCHHWHQLAQMRLQPQKSSAGVPSDVKDGRRTE
jgi:hypothetical protein